MHQTHQHAFMVTFIAMGTEGMTAPEACDLQPGLSVVTYLLQGLHYLTHAHPGSQANQRRHSCRSITPAKLVCQPKGPAGSPEAT